MKQRLISLALVGTLLLAACASDEESITKAAYGYSHAMANYDVEGAERFATPETRATTLEMARTLLAMVDSAYIASDTPAEIEIRDIQLVDDTSAVVTYHKHTPIKDFSATLDMRRRRGRWLAHTPIEQKELPAPPAHAPRD